MKKILFLAFFYSTTNLLVFGGFNTISAQTPKHNRKLDSLRLDSLIKMIPDSVKKDIARSFEKIMDDLQKYSSPAASKSKTEFENNMAKALNLKLVVRDTDFKFSRLRIFKDTLFGAYKRAAPGKVSFSSAPNEYFIQNLSDTSRLTEFINYDLNYYTPPRFDCYRQGCIYMGYGSGMRTLCADGKLTEYFGQKADDLNYAYKVFLYKNQAILIREKDIKAFDISSQKVIWKYTFKKRGTTYSLLKGDSLFFSTWIDRVATVCCYNLDKQSIIWQKRIMEREPNFRPADYDPSYCLFQDNNNLILPAWDTCYSLNMNTGNVIGKVCWKAFWANDNVFFKVDNSRLYIEDLSNGLKTSRCIDINTNKLLWELQDSYFLGLHKNYVIANNTDWSCYLIIDKSTGSIKYKIPAPISDRKEFNFIGNYILINENAIYK